MFKGTRPLIQKQGIKVETGLKLDKLEKTKSGVKVSGKNAKGDTVTLEAEMLLVAVGRMAYLENLGLENTKVKVSDRGTVEVNEYCETAEPGIFAIGDVLPTAQLAHLASKKASLSSKRSPARRSSQSNTISSPTAPTATPRSRASASRKRKQNRQAMT